MCDGSLIGFVLLSQVLCLLVKIYQRLPSPDYLSICQCLMFLNEPDTVATILEKLLSGSKVLSFVILFELCSNADVLLCFVVCRMMHFLHFRLLLILRKTNTKPFY